MNIRISATKEELGN